MASLDWGTHHPPFDVPGAPRRVGRGPERAPGGRSRAGLPGRNRRRPRVSLVGDAHGRPCARRRDRGRARVHRRRALRGSDVLGGRKRARPGYPFRRGCGKDARGTAPPRVRGRSARAGARALADPPRRLRRPRLPQRRPRLDQRRPLRLLRRRHRLLGLGDGSAHPRRDDRPRVAVDPHASARSSSRSWRSWPSGSCSRWRSSWSRPRSARARRPGSSTCAPPRGTRPSGRPRRSARERP